MNSDTIEKLKEVMIPVAQKIGEGAEWGWKVVMKQQYVAGIGFGITAFVFLCVMIVGIILIYKGVKYKSDDSWDDTKAWLIVPGIAITIIGIIFCATSTFETIARFINPEYYAIEFFIDAVKPAHTTTN